jgi:hypothetical protein
MTIVKLALINNFQLYSLNLQLGCWEFYCCFLFINEKYFSAVPDAIIHKRVDERSFADRMRVFGYQQHSIEQ